MVLLSGLAIQITSQVVNTWSRSSGKLSSSLEARLAMDVIANDLEELVLRNDGYEWFRAENDFIKFPVESKSVALSFLALSRINQKTRKVLQSQEIYQL